MLIFRHKPKHEDTLAYGFSLLEMLIVLAIMGLILSLISVRMVSSIESSRFSQTASAAMEDIKLVRVRAMLDKTAVRIVPTDTVLDAKTVETFPLNLPEGWVVKGDIIAISKTGYCSGGNLTLTNPGNRKIAFSLSAPKCEAVRVPMPDNG